MGATKTVKETFTREQLTEAKRYKNRRDLLDALLEDGRAYTIAEVDKKISDYLGKKVGEWL